MVKNILACVGMFVGAGATARIALRRVEGRMILSQRCQGLGALVLTLLVVALFSAGCGQKADSLDQLLVNAKEERDKGNRIAAVIHLKNVLQKSPEHAEARYLLGLIYSDAGDFAYAEKELRKALELQYDRPKVIPALGRALLMTGEFQKVLDQVRMEGDVGKKVQAEIVTLRALAAIGLGRDPEGRELLEQALTMQPEFPEALLGQARLAASERKLEDAGRLIDRAIASAPKNIDAWIMKGDLSRSLGDMNAAAAAYQKALEANPDHLLSWVNVALVQIDSGNFHDARNHVERMRRIAPNSPIVKYIEGLLEFRQRNFAAAREAVLQVLRAVPNHVPSMLLAGAIEFAQGSHVQAQWYLERVIERTPDDPYARRLLIAALAKNGAVQRSQEMLQPMLKQFPVDGPLMALAGEIYLQSNEFARAAQFFEKAAKLDPKNANARTGLGLSRLASGDTDHALADLEYASQLDFDQYHADILLVTSRLRQANFDAALTAVQTLEKKQPNNPLTYNLKAAVYLAKKDTATARKYLEHALELQPAYVPASTNLAQLDLQERNPQAARGRLETILRKDKDNVQALLALANLGPRIGASWKEQIDWLERARRANPALVQPQIMLARVYAQAGDVKSALEAARRAQSISPDGVEVLDTLGAIQSAVGRMDQALVTYRTLATLRPNSPEVLYRLAAAQAANADQLAAVGSLKNALSLRPDFIDAQVALAGLEIRAGRLPEAMKIARQVQERAAKSPEGFVLEGDVRMAEHQFAQAAKAYEIAYGIRKSGLLTVKLHAAYAQAGNPDEAERRLGHWLKQWPDDSAVRLYAAGAALKSGNHRGAIGHYEWLLQKQPDNVLVLNNLAWTYHQVKDARALVTAERAYKLKPDNAAVADTLGWILVDQGNVTRGLGLLQEAVAAAPHSKEIRYHLAKAWLKAGERPKARSELAQLLAAGDVGFPQQAEAMNLLRQLEN